MWKIEKNETDCFYIDKNRFFKIDNEAYDILYHLNKGRSIDEVSEITNTHIEDIVGLLSELKRLSTSHISRRRIYPIFRILPHHLSEKIGRFLTFLFVENKKYLLLPISFIAVSIYYFLNSSTLYAPQHISFLAYVIAFFFISILHELGHIAAACRIGLKGDYSIFFGFYSFLFVFYVNNLSYLYLYDKKKRLIVNIGGVYFQLLLFIPILIGLYFGIFKMFLCALFWVNIIIATFNIFPFFITDGYWILSDFIANGELNKKCNIISREILAFHIPHNIPARIWVYWVLRFCVFLWLLFFWIKMVGNRILNAPEMYYILIEKPLEFYTLIRLLFYLFPIILPIIYIKKRYVR